MTQKLLFTISLLFAFQLSAQELIFQSGFEPGTRVKDGETSSDLFDIRGEDVSLPNNSNWDYVEGEGIEQGPVVRKFSMRYGGGNVSQRYARLVQDPQNPNNNVLKYHLNEANQVNSSGIPNAGRIQSALYFQKAANMNEFYCEVKVFLPTNSWNAIKAIQSRISWLMPFELWDDNNPNTDSNLRSRISVNYFKEKEGAVDNLFWRVSKTHSSDSGLSYETSWDVRNTKIPVPIGKWVTYEYYVKHGDVETGRFFMAITPDGEQKQVLFDIRNITTNPANNSSTSFTSLSPMKLYTSPKTINEVRGKNGTIDILWDDFEFWINKKPSCTLNAGSISGNQRSCGSFDPRKIIGTDEAISNGGSVSYSWRKKVNRVWTNIQNATGKDYNPSTINTTTIYQRLTRTNGCSDTPLLSNTVRKEVYNAGIINGEESNCGRFDPALILGDIPSTLTENIEINFQWHQRELGGSWKLIQGATQNNYDPIAIKRTTFYKRIAQVGNCKNLHSNVVKKEVAYGITDAGTITGNETNCKRYNPSEIKGTVAFGGYGAAIQYQWRRKINGKWEKIPNATNQNYTPPRITTTAYYQRLAFRGNCEGVYSNVISKIKTGSCTEAKSNISEKPLNEKLKIILFPNPAGDFVNIYSPDEIDVKKLHIYDISGRAVENHKINYKLIRNNTFSIRTSHLETGIYTVQLDLVDGTFEMLRLTVKHD